MTPFFRSNDYCVLYTSKRTFRRTNVPNTHSLALLIFRHEFAHIKSTQTPHFRTVISPLNHFLFPRGFTLPLILWCSDIDPIGFCRNQSCYTWSLRKCPKRSGLAHSIIFLYCLLPSLTKKAEYTCQSFTGVIRRSLHNLDRSISYMNDRCWNISNR